MTSNTNVTPAAERKKRLQHFIAWLIPPIRIERLRILPNTWIAMNSVRLYSDRVALWDEIAAEMRSRRSPTWKALADRRSEP